jgi:hypothetical protein
MVTRPAPTDPEAARFHRLLVEHTIQAVTERFRPERAAELDDMVIKVCTCDNRFVGVACPRCQRDWIQP